MPANKNVKVSIYPPREVDSSLASKEERHAIIVAVDPDSPAYFAGFEPGCVLLTLDGKPIIDILDWKWRSDTAQITLSYEDSDGDTGEIVLRRENDEPWGFHFDDLIFDRIYECKNACLFCFMRQLPSDMRPSLRLRDDDYRLSFLSGTFITLTNLSETDVERIVEQRISPLHISLHAIEPEIRHILIGKHAEKGIEILERLLEAGIQCYCQIVLVPGVNDGDHLKATLDWASEHEGILGIGIVPLGYTKHQDRFKVGFDLPLQAEEVIELLKPYQQRALQDRGDPWAYAADEFYLTAYGRQVFDILPDASFYGDFDMFEDGIGMVRSTLDDWAQAHDDGLLALCGDELEQQNCMVYMVSGFAQQAYLTILMRDPHLKGRLAPLYVENEFFGGNVNVTGLLTARDIIRTLRSLGPVLVDKNPLVIIPRVIFNDEGMTLDDMTLDDIAKQIDLPLRMVSCSTLDYLCEIVEFVKELNG